MKAYDYEAVVYRGAVYCADCCPVPVEADDVIPIFASNEVDSAPVCDACGEIHDYMLFTEEHYRREAEAAGEEQAQEFIERPFSVLVPWVPDDERTEWHPTEKIGLWSVLTRGAFQTEKEARQWAREHLNGNPYSVVKR